MGKMQYGKQNPQYGKSSGHI